MTKDEGKTGGALARIRAWIVGSDVLGAVLGGLAKPYALWHKARLERIFALDRGPSMSTHDQAALMFVARRPGETRAQFEHRRRSQSTKPESV